MLMKLENIISGVSIIAVTLLLTNLKRIKSSNGPHYTTTNINIKRASTMARPYNFSLLALNFKLVLSPSHHGLNIRLNISD